MESTLKRQGQYLAETLIGAVYADDLKLLANAPVKVESLLNHLVQASFAIGLHLNSEKTEFMCSKQDGAISTLNNNLLKSIDSFTYLGSNISSTESDINIRIGQGWIAIDTLSTFQ